MVELFLRNNADPGARTKDGDTPVEIALRMGHSEVAERLRAARQESERHAAAAHAQPQAG